MDNKDNIVDINDLKEEKEKTPSLFEGVLSGLGEANFGDLEDLGALLALPDEQFMLLSGAILLELEKSLNDVNDRILMIQGMNAAGVKAEDIAVSYLQISQQIDEQLSNILSRPKRDFLKRMLGMVANAINETEGMSKRTIQIPIEICHENAKIPAYAKVGDAGMDIFALEDIEVKPGETKLIPTGIKVAIPIGYELQVRPKSGRALKTKLRVANTPGTIDSGYRDEIGVIIENIEPSIKDITYEFDSHGRPIITSIEHGRPFIIEKGSKFAQLVLSEVPTASFYEVDDVGKIGENRGGGFGSTGVK